MKWYEGAVVFRVFIFIFLFRTNGKKEHLDENNFLHYYGNFFEGAIGKVALSQPCFNFFLNNYDAHSQRHLKNTLQSKTLQTSINIRDNSYFGKDYETKIHEGD